MNRTVGVDAPAAAEVADVDLAIEAHFHIAHAHAGGDGSGAGDGVARAGGFHRDVEQVAARDRATVVSQQKVPSQISRHGVARGISHAGRAARHIRGGRIHPLRLHFIERGEHFLRDPHGFRRVKLLPIERADILVRGLMAHVPARVRAFQRIDHARLVADVARVVEGEKVAQFIKGQLRGIAQAFAEDLKAAAI